jgi:hypothetical protein
MAAYLAGQATEFDDPDDTLDDDGTDFVMRRGFYGLRVLKDAVGFTYTSRVTGSQIRIRLTEIDGNTVGAIPAPVRIGQRLVWQDVAPGNDFHLLLRPQNVELYKIIKNASAGRRFRWRVTESDDRALWGPDKDLQTQGHDNYLMQDASREGLGVGRVRRRLQMAAPIKGAEDSTTFPGFVTYQFLERWTGQTIALDANRVPSLSTDVSYPCQIDILVTENIAANGDDGHQTMSGGAWNNSYGSTGDLIIYDPGGAGNRYLPGWRFTTVNIPQGTTTDDATLTIVGRVNSSGTGAAATLYGWDIDDSPAWANNAGPGNMTKTTASVSFGTWGSNQANPTTKNLDVKSIVDEIFARAGWAANNDLSLGVDFTENNNGSFHYFDDVAGGGSPGVLTINYTASGGGSTAVPVFYTHLTQQGIA